MSQLINQLNSAIAMARVHPKSSLMITTSSADFTSSKQETFTLWMKSLVINGNGCSVFDSGGRLRFRVDNYQKRCSREVLLMNFDGHLLFSIKSKVRIYVLFRLDGKSVDSIECRKIDIFIK